MKEPEGMPVDVLGELDAIKERIDKLVSLAMWAILAEQRFCVGDRVTFSPQAIRQGMNKRRKSQFGRVEEVSDHFSIKVRLDGAKKATSWHHAFFQQVQ
jgi:hypothetical protein